MVRVRVRVRVRVLRFLTINASSVTLSFFLRDHELPVLAGVVVGWAASAARAVPSRIGKLPARKC